MRESENIRQVEALHPDWMGFICWKHSPRYLQASPAYLPKECLRVGVFINPSPDYVLEQIAALQLSLVQLHGKESPEWCHELKNKCAGLYHPVQIIKAFGISSEKAFPATKDYEESCDYFLFDNSCPSAGGSGMHFNWNLLEKYTGKTSFLLSGGIGIDDIAHLEEFDHPQWIGIDLNSRFELSPALKDVASLKTFMNSLNR